MVIKIKLLNNKGVTKKKKKKVLSSLVHGALLFWSLPLSCDPRATDYPILRVTLANLSPRIMKKAVWSHTEEIHLCIPAYWFGSESFSVGMSPLFYGFCNVAHTTEFKWRQRQWTKPAVRLSHMTSSQYSSGLTYSCLSMSPVRTLTITGFHVIGVWNEH